MKLCEIMENIQDEMRTEYEEFLKEGFRLYGFDVNNIHKYKNKIEQVYVVNEHDGYFTLNLLNSISHFFYDGLYLFSISGKYEDGVYKLELFTDYNMYNKIKGEQK